MIILWILIGFGLLFLLQRAVYTSLWNKGVSVTFRFSKRAVTEGDSVELIERSENRKLLPLPSFGYRYSLSRNFSASSGEGEKALSLKRKFALPGRRAVTNRAQIKGLIRGVYCVDEVSTFSSDLFHSADLGEPVEFGSSRLTVYPKKLPVRRFSFAARQLLGAAATRRRAQEDPFALRSIRPYEIYDSPRVINWKASAKTGELKVNQFENTTDESLMLLLDMSGGEPEAKEELIRLASSLSLFFLRRGVSVSLMANCRSCISGRPVRVPAGADAAHQITVDENLALIKLTMPLEGTFAGFLSGISDELLQGAMPVVISADTTGAAREAFLRTPVIRDGYYLSVGENGNIETESGLSLKSRSDAGKEMRL